MHLLFAVGAARCADAAKIIEPKFDDGTRDAARHNPTILQILTAFLFRLRVEFSVLAVTMTTFSLFVTYFRISRKSN